MSKRKDTNWEEKLTESEKINDNGKTMVFLKGLQRLAEEAGLCKSSCVQQHVPIGDFGVFQAIYTVEFDDGSIYVGTADCNKQNTGDPFLNYPTAVAESRAESRALRKALNIRMLAYEEVGFDGANVINNVSKLTSDQKADQQVIKAIESALSKKGLSGSLLDILRNVLGSDRCSNVVGLNDLTISEAQTILREVNMYEVKISNSDVGNRAARKELLKQKVNE